MSKSQREKLFEISKQLKKLSTHPNTTFTTLTGVIKDEPVPKTRQTVYKPLPVYKPMGSDKP